VHYVVNLSEQDQRMVVQSLRAVGCQHVELLSSMCAICCAACVSVTTVDEFHIFWRDRHWTVYLPRPVQAHIFANPENTAWVKNTVHEGRC